MEVLSLPVNCTEILEPEVVIQETEEYLIPDEKEEKDDEPEPDIDVTIIQKGSLISGMPKKEYFKKYMKDYVKNAENKICECGGKFKSYQLSLHKNTKKHKTFESNIDSTKKVSDNVNNAKIIKQIQTLINKLKL